MHTALKIAPVYHAPVVHLKDASQNAGVAAQLLQPESKAALVAQLNRDYEELRGQKRLVSSRNGITRRGTEE